MKSKIKTIFLILIIIVLAAVYAVSRYLFMILHVIPVNFRRRY